MPGEGGTVAFVLNREGRRVGESGMVGGQGNVPKLHNNSCTSQPFIKFIEFIKLTIIHKTHKVHKLHKTHKLHNRRATMKLWREV